MTSHDSSVYVRLLSPSRFTFPNYGLRTLDHADRLCECGRAIVAVLLPYGVAVLLTRYGPVTVFVVLGMLLARADIILFWH